MGLSDALNNLVNKISGGGSGAGTPAKTGATGGAGCVGGANSPSGGGGYANSMAEEAIGNQLAGIDKEPLSAKSAEEKANSALEDLMGKLGISSGSEDEISAVRTEIENEIKAKKAEKAEGTEETKETEKSGEVDTTGIEDQFDGMTQEELEALKEELDDYLEFSPEEADAYVKGEAELQSRIDEAVANNPDMDPEAIAKEIREAYELENPEWADAAREAERVEAQHTEAMNEAYNAFCEENPQPAKEDFDSPAEYAEALNKWSAEVEKHMQEAEKKYREENQNYDNLKNAELKHKILEGRKPFEIDPSDLKPIVKDPDEPGSIYPIEIDPSDLKPIFKDADIYSNEKSPSDDELIVTYKKNYLDD